MVFISAVLWRPNEKFSLLSDPSQPLAFGSSHPQWMFYDLGVFLTHGSSTCWFRACLRIGCTRLLCPLPRWWLCTQPLLALRPSHCSHQQRAQAGRFSLQGLTCSCPVTIILSSPSFSFSFIDVAPWIPVACIFCAPRLAAAFK